MKKGLVITKSGREYLGGKYLHTYLVKIKENGKTVWTYDYYSLEKAIEYCRKMREQDKLMGIDNTYQYEIIG